MLAASESQEFLAKDFGRLNVGSKQTWNSLTIPQLKDELKKNKLSTTGKRKEDYVQRLHSYFEFKLNTAIDLDFVGNVRLFIIEILVNIKFTETCRTLNDC